MQTISFVESSRVKVKGLLSLNSQMFHIVINRCRNVKINDIRIVADGKSPNTDGIHVQLSTDVEIRNASIKTGDDCISIGPGTKNLWVERVTCGPGHGIRWFNVLFSRNIFIISSSMWIYIHSSKKKKRNTFIQWSWHICVISRVYAPITYIFFFETLTYYLYICKKIIEWLDYTGKFKHLVWLTI